jgi:hypothetical protein
MNEELMKLLSHWPPITNWRTSLTGAAMIAAGVMALMHISIAGVTVSTDPWTLIVGGFGLIMAKDGATHSTMDQVVKATAEAPVKKEG